MRRKPYWPMVALIVGGDVLAQAVAPATTPSTVASELEVLATDLDHRGQLAEPSVLDLRPYTERLKTALYMRQGSFFDIGEGCLLYKADSSGPFTVSCAADFFTAAAQVVTLKSVALGSCTASEVGQLRKTDDGTHTAYYCADSTWWRVALTLTATATLDFGSIAAQDCEDLTATVTGATAGQVATCSPADTLPSTASGPHCRVSAADTVTVRVCNVGSGAVDPASMDYAIAVER